MGQQQILLLFLGIIIIAIAVTIAINNINSNHEESNKDELVNNLLTIGADAQQWFRKPVKLDGGGGAFNNSKGADTTYQIPADLRISNNGKYLIDSIDDSVLFVKALPDSSLLYGWFVKAKVTPKQVTVEILNN